MNLIDKLLIRDPLSRLGGGLPSININNFRF